MEDIMFKIDELVTLIQGVNNIGYMHYDGFGHFLDERIPGSYSFRQLFEIQLLPQLMEAHRYFEDRRPFLISDHLCMTYTGVMFRDSSDEEHICVLGPIFYDNISMPRVQSMLLSHNVPLPMRHKLLDEMKKLPVIYLYHFLDFGRMMTQIALHHPVDSSAAYLMDLQKPEDNFSSSFASVPTHGTWELEERMKQLVRTGNLNYAEEMRGLENNGQAGILSTRGHLQQLRYMLICQTVLVSRAAIDGGLSPETSLTLSDYYIQKIDQADDLNELREIGAQLIDDYIHRVHAIRSGSDYSAPIRQCVDFISFHYAEEINTEKIASKAGYSASYLSKKFREETGCSLTNYIVKVRLDHAITMLREPDRSIAEVCDAIGFHSQSYFGVQFKKYTGTTPGQFRATGRLPNLDGDNAIEGA